MILAIINMMLDFHQFNKVKDSSTAQNAVMAIISGLIWPFSIVMNIIDLVKFIFLRRLAARNTKIIILSMCKAESMDVDSRTIKLKLKRKGSGHYFVVGRNKFTKNILEHLKITDMSFKIYHE